MPVGGWARFLHVVSARGIILGGVGGGGGGGGGGVGWGYTLEETSNCCKDVQLEERVM